MYPNDLHHLVIDNKPYLVEPPVADLIRALIQDCEAYEAAVKNYSDVRERGWPSG